MNRSQALSTEPEFSLKVSYPSNMESLLHLIWQTQLAVLDDLTMISLILLEGMEMNELVS